MRIELLSSTASWHGLTLAKEVRQVTLVLDPFWATDPALHADAWKASIILKTTGGRVIEAKADGLFELSGVAIEPFTPPMGESHVGAIAVAEAAQEQLRQGLQTIMFRKLNEKEVRIALGWSKERGFYKFGFRLQGTPDTPINFFVQMPQHVPTSGVSVAEAIALVSPVSV